MLIAAFFILFFCRLVLLPCFRAVLPLGHAFFFFFFASSRNFFFRGLLDVGGRSGAAQESWWVAVRVFSSFCLSCDRPSLGAFFFFSFSHRVLFIPLRADLFG